MHVLSLSFMHSLCPPITCARVHVFLHTVRLSFWAHNRFFMCLKCLEIIKKQTDEKQSWSRSWPQYNVCVFFCYVLFTNWSNIVSSFNLGFFDESALSGLEKHMIVFSHMTGQWLVDLLVVSQLNSLQVRNTQRHHIWTNARHGYKSALLHAHVAHMFWLCFQSKT